MIENAAGFGAMADGDRALHAEGQLPAGALPVTAAQEKLSGLDPGMLIDIATATDPGTFESEQLEGEILPDEYPEPLLRGSEVAVLFGVSPHSVNRWASQGRIPSSRTPGGHYRYRLSQVKRLFEQQSQPEAPQD